MLWFYELRLLPYIPLTPETWFLIILSALMFLIGCIMPFVAKDSLLKESSDDLRTKEMKIFSDEGKALRLTIVVLGIIGLLSSIQHWMILFKMFGSLPSIFINANIIYQLRIENRLEGVIPYLVIFNYVALFFAAVYSAGRGKISILTLIPVLGIILKEIANVGRAGIFLGAIEFLSVFLIVKHFSSGEKDSSKKIFVKGKRILGLTIVVGLLIVAASFIRSIRGTYESFSGASRQLSSLQSSEIITPSIYLYFSSHIAVLSRYLQDDEEHHKTSIGENTFLTIYSVLSKFDLVERPSDYQQGYRIPMWSNTGTFIRELHADFGILGAVTGPFFMAFFTVLAWFRFFNTGSLRALSLLTFLMLVTSFSFFMMATRMGIWTISLTFLLIFTPSLEKLALRFRDRMKSDALTSVRI